MRYVTRDAIGAFIPPATLLQLSNDDPAADAPDEAVIASVVAEMEDLVDGYMRGRYTLPFDPVPTVLRGAALSLIRYELYARRPEGAIPDAVTDARKHAIKLLETIRDGLITLGIADGQSAPEPGEIRVRARRQRFGDKAWRHY
ncbi:TPA: gp436 family protein [Klebsiella pneumoniae]